MKKHILALLVASPAVLMAQVQQQPARPGQGAATPPQAGARPMQPPAATPGAPGAQAARVTPPAPPVNLAPTGASPAAPMAAPAAAPAAATRTGGSNPFARGAGQVAAPAPVASAPKLPTPVVPVPTPAASAPKKEEVVEEDVPSIRVGKVNGEYIYRGTNTYLFEDLDKRKIVRKPTKAAVPAAGAASGAKGQTPNLPSSVGRPTNGAAPATPNPQPATAGAPATNMNPRPTPAPAAGAAPAGAAPGSNAAPRR